jgi:signal recognition particle GTPase
MGDIMSLIERAEQAVDKKAAMELERKLRKNEFTLEDFRDQLKQVRKMGRWSKLWTCCRRSGRWRICPRTQKWTRAC